MQELLLQTVCAHQSNPSRMTNECSCTKHSQPTAAVVCSHATRAQLPCAAAAIPPIIAEHNCHPTNSLPLTMHIRSACTATAAGAAYALVVVVVAGLLLLSVLCLLSCSLAFLLSLFFFCVARCSRHMASSSAGRPSHSFILSP